MYKKKKKFNWLWFNFNGRDGHIRNVQENSDGWSISLEFRNCLTKRCDFLTGILRRKIRALNSLVFTLKHWISTIQPFRIDFTLQYFRKLMASGSWPSIFANRVLWLGCVELSIAILAMQVDLLGGYVLAILAQNASAALTSKQAY
jgi:hypothetical protein